MSQIPPNELIGAEVVDTGYYDKDIEAYDWICLKLKNGKVAKIEPTNWDTIWISYEE